MACSLRDNLRAVFFAFSVLFPSGLICVAFGGKNGTRETESDLKAEGR